MQPLVHYISQNDAGRYYVQKAIWLDPTNDFEGVWSRALGRPKMVH